jgi:hypothetical protein
MKVMMIETLVDGNRPFVTHTTVKREVHRVRLSQNTVDEKGKHHR